MVEFSGLPKYFPFACARCGQEDRGPEGQTRCTLCRYHQENPTEAPGYFTWTKLTGGWAATAKWREQTPLPETGQTITVHRRDSNSSLRQVSRIGIPCYDRAGNLVITVQVS